MSGISKLTKKGALSPLILLFFHYLSRTIVILNWLREIEQEDIELVDLNQQNMELSQINHPNTDLERQLAEARLKIKALETMIDIAEEQFKISIRKKSGAKQSKG